ncbi:hypothetical protein JTB14_013067 [Gonioctena quinquepunctata]|nr:hypothetical protein JTB14_013067 [Gonioctena quinquepunctata]
MNSIAQTDEIMANFLGIESKKRVKRSFWENFAPSVFGPIAEAFLGTFFGDKVDQQQLQRYNEEIWHLKGTQQEIINEVNVQRTIFMIDSERKSNQIEYLKTTQDGIKNELNILQSTFSQDSEEKENKIKDLNDMLSETQRKLKSQEEKQQRLISDVEMIEDGVKRINDDLDDIRREITVNKINIEANKIETRLNSISVNFNFLLSRFVSEQKTLLDVIKNANRGFLDPYIITPLNLIEMLQEVQHILPEDSRFPFYPTFRYAKNLYNIIKPTVSFYNNTILFILRIPLVHARTFEFFKMTSLPMAVGDNKFVFVLPKKEYLLINDKLDHLLEYVLTSAMDFGEVCEDLGDNKYICDHIQQINGASSNSECEVQLYLNKKELSTSCNIRVMKLDKPIFLQLQRYGSWIFMAPESENVIISCGNSRKNVRTYERHYCWEHHVDTANTDIQKKHMYLLLQ